MLSTKRISIGGGVAAFVVLAGLALSLSNKLRSETLALVLLVGGGIFLILCVLVAAWRWASDRITLAVQTRIKEEVQSSVREHLVRDVRPWVKEDVARAIADNAEGGRKLAEMLLKSPSEATQPMAEAKLRLALNELSEELEYILDRIKADDPGYWHGSTLPKEKWVAHGSMLGSVDDRGHEALRGAYREADRINHCLADQPSRVDFEGGPIDSRSVEGCDPGRYEAAFHNATVEIARMQRELAAGR